MTREEAKEFIAQSVKSDVDMALVADAIKALEQEPCEDAVSRQAAIEAVEQAIYNHDSAIMRLTELPSVTPAQKTGRWMPIGYDGYADGCPVIDEWECSECGWEHTGDEDTLICYCPNCGYHMVKPKESEEEE